MDAERWQILRRHLEALLPMNDRARDEYLCHLTSDEEELVSELREWLPFAEETVDRFEKPLFDVHFEGELGKDFGAYRTSELLGRGGMGSVFLATRKGSDRPLALKVIRAGFDYQEILRRFEMERQILATLDHPGIARILDGGTSADGRPFFVMEAVEGEPIDRYCDRQRLSIRQRLKLFQQVCAAVQWAHANLVVHCDLKPSNILITPEGFPKLLDFGIARVLRPSGGAREATAQGLLTLQFASPEQVRGEPITTACDVYALGVLLYLLLSGRRPYDLSRISQSAAAQRICSWDPPPPSSTVLGEQRGPRWARRLSGDLDSIVLQAMAKQPSHRYASVEQLVDDLERHQMSQPVRARPATWLYRGGRFVRRHRLAVAAVGMIVAFAVSTTLLWFQAKAERDSAVVERQRADQGAEFLGDIFRQTALATRQDPAATGAALQVEVMDRLLDRAFVDPWVQADILVSVGTAQLDLGQYDRAEELFERARQLLVGLVQHAESGDRSRRRLAKAANNLAGVYFRRGQERRAEKMYRLALVMWSPDMWSPDMESPPNRSSDGDDRWGHSEALAAATVDADNAKTWGNLAVLLLRRGAFEEADRILDRVLALRRRRIELGMPQAGRNLSKSLLHLGSLRLQEQRFDAAQVALEESLAVGVGEGSEADRAKVWSKLGRLQLARGELGQAAEYLRLASRGVAPSLLSVSLQRNLAMLALRRGQMAEAEAQLRGLLAGASDGQAQQEGDDVYNAEDGDDYGEAMFLRSLLACSLTPRGQHDEAERLLTSDVGRTSAEVIAERRGHASLDAQEARCHVNAWRWALQRKEGQVVPSSTCCPSRRTRIP